MPSARTFEDADLVTTLSGFSGQTRSTLSFQITPRLTGSFRYSRIGGFQPGGRTLYDRSFDISYQILAESGTRPALAIGLRDIVGTGIYSGEYIVATKSFGENVRLTGGLGWGRLGSHGGLGAPFGTRPPLDYGLGGRLTDDQWFRGDVAPFGGVEWAVTDKLSLSAEYSSDAYTAEEARGLINRSSPLNVGVSYRFDNGTQLSGYWLHGSELGFGLTFALNPRVSNAPTGTEPGPLPVRPRPSRASDPEAWTTDWTVDTAGISGLRQSIAEALAKEGILLEAMSLDARRARLSIRNTRYEAQPEALGRTARILTRALPASIETFVITLVTAHGLPSSSVSLDRRDLERLEFADADAIRATVEVSDPAEQPPPDSMPMEARFTWALEPYTTFSLFDPDSPVRAELGLRLRGRAELGNGFVLAGSAKKIAVGNLDKIDNSVTSGLPQVRSDISIYNTEGDPALESLTIAHYGRPAANLYSRVTTGYLESMFGGVSGEVLWKPVDSRLAIGAEVNWVQKRDYDQQFGFQDYDVVTGHVSTYYEFGNGFLGQLDVGQYLAGDVGATLSLAREFDNGWLVGAYATRTDATFADFGEGSFDKGIRIVIPTEWFRGEPSRASRELDLRSLSRDGGARLKVDGRLYDTVRDAHVEDLDGDWGRFWR
ncbi:MAG: YjbH domain-containing protein [Silicimonas sp.]|nr:YjbH domain-containing protein [Silicimonas sp.]